MIVNDEIKLLEFVPDHQKSKSSILIVGKRGSGKSWIIRDLMYHYRETSCGVVVSRADFMSRFYRWFFPDLYIHYNAENMALCMMYRQEKIAKLADQQYADAVFVLDDSMTPDTLECMDYFLESSINLTTIVAVQNINGILAKTVKKFDYVFFTGGIDNNTAELYNRYKLKDIFQQLPKYTALCIDNKGSTESPVDNLYWFKAQDRDFVFGSKKFINSAFVDDHDANFRTLQNHSKKFCLNNMHKLLEEPIIESDTKSTVNLIADNKLHTCAPVNHSVSDNDSKINFTISHKSANATTFINVTDCTDINLLNNLYKCIHI